MEDSPATIITEGSLSRAIDSNELRMKQRRDSHLQSIIHHSQDPQSGIQEIGIASPQRFSELHPDARITSISTKASPKPCFIQSSVYPQRIKPDLQIASPSSHILNPNQVSDNKSVPNQGTPFTPLDIYPFGLNSSDFSINPNPNALSRDSSSPTITPCSSASTPTIKTPQVSNNFSQYSIQKPVYATPDQLPPPNPKNPNPIHSDSTPDVHKPNPPSPTRYGTSPSRKLQAIFQKEGEKLAFENCITSLVQSLEDELLKSGVSVSLSQFKSHILQVQETFSNSGIATSSSPVNLEGEFVEPINKLPSQDHSKEPKGMGNSGKTHNWASLFKAQAPSKSMKLEHYPDM